MFMGAIALLYPPPPLRVRVRATVSVNSDVSRPFGSPVYWFGHPNSGAQKWFFNFLFFCSNSTKKYIEEVGMA